MGYFFEFQMFLPHLLYRFEQIFVFSLSFPLHLTISLLFHVPLPFDCHIHRKNKVRRWARFAQMGARVADEAEDAQHFSLLFHHLVDCIPPCLICFSISPDHLNEFVPREHIQQGIIDGFG